MEEKELIELVDINGNKKQVEVITYLVSSDKLRQYVVYTQGEVRGANNDHVIYISKLYKDKGNYQIEEIVDDTEWSDVQRLLKQIANAD